MSDNYGDYEAVIGLEIHCQLNTKSKLFGREPNFFGAEPNTNIGFVDTGQPGSLPVLNKEAVRKSIAFGLAVGATINKTSYFDRKSYFYPDCPYNYQITQFYNPISTGGAIECVVIGEKKTFTIEHTHIENDAGKLVHFPGFTGVDYNRSGAPLIEIVSDPCMRTPKEAAVYASTIRDILEYIGSSDCNMQEGHFRMDANISVRLKGEKSLRPKAEIKNINSFANMELAIESQIRSQIQFYTNNPGSFIKTGTYKFDAEKQKTILMREKESADDYRYFPEPDLPPLRIHQSLIKEIAQSLPELPLVKKERFEKVLGLSQYFTDLLIADKKLCDYFEQGQKHSSNTKSFCNWCVVEFTARSNELNKHLVDLQIPSENIAQLVNMIEEKVITGKIAKEIANMMCKNPERTAKEIVDSDDRFRPMDDLVKLEEIITLTVEKNPTSIEDYKNGKEKAFQFLVGQVMKQTKGKAPPALVKDLIIKKIR